MWVIMAFLFISSGLILFILSMIEYSKKKDGMVLLFVGVILFIIGALFGIYELFLINFQGQESIISNANVNFIIPFFGISGLIIAIIALIALIIMAIARKPVMIPGVILGISSSVFVLSLMTEFLIWWFS